MCRVALFAFLALIAIGSPHADLGTAVEFYNPALNHSFLAAFPDEIATLDTGTNIRGWTRTDGQ